MTTTLNEKPKSSKPVVCLKIQQHNITIAEPGTSSAGIIAILPQLIPLLIALRCNFQLGQAMVITPQHNRTSPTVAISNINSKSLVKIPPMISNCPIILTNKY